MVEIGGAVLTRPHVHHHRFTIQTAHSLIMMSATCDKKCTTVVRVTHGMSRNRQMFITDSLRPIQNLFFCDDNIEDTIIYNKLAVKIIRKMFDKLNSKTESKKEYYNIFFNEFLKQKDFMLESNLYRLKR